MINRAENEFNNGVTENTNHDDSVSNTICCSEINSIKYHLYCFKSKLYQNFLLFTIFYSATHATVDAVLAFSSAELGNDIGSLAGFILYIFYTLSALTLAKPIVSSFGPKLSVVLGLTSLLIYVCFFFLAIMFDSIATIIFMIGSIIGGCGAGILWTGQSTYYALNADLYSESESHINSINIVNFAAIFAALYLSFEAFFKFISTLIYITSKESNNSLVSWQIIVFGFYAFIAFISVIAFNFMIMPLYISNNRSRSPSTNENVDSTTVNNAIYNEYSELSLQSNEDIYSEHNNIQHHDKNIKLDYNYIVQQSSVVLKSIYYDRKLLYMMPYQICFGITSGFINTYINGNIVKNGVGEGYIGLLSGLAVLSAVIMSYPYAVISNSYKDGKYYIMIFGSLCYFILGFTVIITTSSILSQWNCIIPYFLVLGASRGIWENTNKAVIAEYYIDIHSRETAYAAIYFSSGFSGAIGFLLSLFISGDVFAIVIVTISIISLVSYHFSTKC